MNNANQRVYFKVQRMSPSLHKWVKVFSCQTENFARERMRQEKDETPDNLFRVIKIEETIL